MATRGNDDFDPDPDDFRVEAVGTAIPLSSSRGPRKKPNPIGFDITPRQAQRAAKKMRKAKR